MLLRLLFSCLLKEWCVGIVTDCVAPDTTTALEALEKGFNDLMDLCDVVTEKFTASRDQFNAESGNRMEA